MEQWLTAHVVVDLSNVAHGIGQARSPDDATNARVAPDIGRMTDVLAHFGIAVTGWTIAIVDASMRRLGAERSRNAARFAAKDSAWVERARREAPVPVTAVAGGFDHQEVGVDDVAVAAAIARAAQLTEDHAIVLLSDDEDVMVALDYIRGPAAFAACRQRAPAGSMHAEVGWIRLGDSAFDHMAPGATQELPERVWPRQDDGDWFLVASDRGDEHVISSPLATRRDGGAHRHVPDTTVPTVAVVDALGITSTATRALGVGRLPRPKSVQRVLGHLGFQGPAAQWFVVPDIEDWSIDGLQGRYRQSAWKHQDNMLEQLIASLKDPDHVLTSVASAMARPHETDRRDPALRTVHEKRTTALLVADVVHALLHTTAHVVVFTDRPEVEVVLRQLASLQLDATRVTRVGTHATTLDAPEALEARHATIKLTEADLAALTCVDGLQYGDELRHALSTLVGAASVEWDVVGFDALGDGIIVRHRTEHDLRLPVADFLASDEQRVRAALRDGVVTGDELRMHLEVRTDRPCDVPEINLDTRPAALQFGEIVAEHGDRIEVDITNDDVADIELSTGHADVPYRERGLVVVTESAGRFQLVGRVLDPPDDAPGLETIEVVDVLHGVQARATGDETRRRVRQGTSLPGPVRAGDRLFAVLDRADGEWRPLSTKLHHLADDASA